MGGQHRRRGCGLVAAGSIGAACLVVRASQPAFEYEPIVDPIVGATFSVDLAAMVAHRTVFGEEVNRVALVDVGGAGLGSLDLSADLFGTSAWPDDPLIDLGEIQTGVFSAAIDPEFFPALVGGSVGLSALFTDTDDALFAIDFVSLSIETTNGAFVTYYGPLGQDENNGYGLGLPDGGDLPAPMPGVLDPTGTGFDEEIASKAIESIPAPGVLAVAACGGLLAARRRRAPGSNGRTGALSRNAAALALACGALALASSAEAGLKIKVHPDKGNAGQVRTLFNHLKRCSGNTPLMIDRDGNVTIGPPPNGGDNKFAAALRAIIGAAGTIELEVGRDIPRIVVGAFRPDANGVTNCTQTIDLDDVEKFPFSSGMIATLWATLGHEAWECHYSKANNARYMASHAEGIKKENEILSDQGLPTFGERDDTCARAPRIISREIVADCVKTVIEASVAFKQSDGSKAWMVLTIEILTKRADGSGKSSQVKKIEVETGTGQTLKRVDVTNPDPSVIRLDGDNNFVEQFENYPGDPDSAPGYLVSAPNGSLYISEEIKNTLERRDARTTDPIQTISDPLLITPQGVDYNLSLGEVFVVSQGENAILAFDDAGVRTRVIRNDLMDGPTDMLIIGDGRGAILDFPDEEQRLYVCNANANNVLILGLEGQLLGELSHPDLARPMGIARDPEGNTYVSSFDNDRVLIFDFAGALSGTLEHAELDGPQGIALSLHNPDEGPSVYVASKNSQRVLEFKDDGTVEVVGHPDMVCPKGMEVTDSVQEDGDREDDTGEIDRRIDQLHLYGPVPNTILVGDEGAVLAAAELGFAGVEGVEVVFENIMGGFAFQSGYVAPDGLSAGETTDVAGLCEMLLLAERPGPALVRVSAPASELEAFAFFEIVQRRSCPADLDGDGDADADDFFAYLDAFAAGDIGVCDTDGDGDCDAEDFFGFLDEFVAGC